MTRTHGSVRGMMLGSLPNITLLDLDNEQRPGFNQAFEKNGVMPDLLSNDTPAFNRERICNKLPMSELSRWSR